MKGGECGTVVGVIIIKPYYKKCDPCITSVPASELLAAAPAVSAAVDYKQYWPQRGGEKRGVR
jgi:hypothetical protein